MLLRKVSPYTLAGFSFLSASLVLLFLSIILGIPPLGPGLFRAVAVTVAINIVATILFYRALSSTDLSLCIPMLAFTPVFLILTSFLILGELPSPAGAAGILMVAFGAYLLNLEYVDGRPSSLSTPFHTLMRDRGVQSMLLVSFLFSISVNFDKQVVENSDPVFGSVIVLFLLGSAFLIIATVINGRSGLFLRKDVGNPDGEVIHGDRDNPDTREHSGGKSGMVPRMDSDVDNPDGKVSHSDPDKKQHSAGTYTDEDRNSQPGTNPLEIDPPSRISRSIPSFLAFPAVGLILVLEVVAINTAYTMNIVPYVITIKRLAIFFSVLYGGLLLGEGQLGGRIFGAIVMIAGAGIIALWG